MDLELAWGLLVIVPLLIIEAIALFHVVARRPDLRVTRKVMWAAGIVLLPVIGALLYALFRPPGLATGKANQEEGPAGSTMQALQQVMASHSAGELDDEGYAAAKRDVFGL